MLHDPFVSYWQEQGVEVTSDLDSLLDQRPDIVIVSAGHKLYKSKSVLEKLMVADPLFVYDTLGLFDEDQLLALQKKHEVSIIGRGGIT